jgi:cation transport protein ChaC
MRRRSLRAGRLFMSDFWVFGYGSLMWRPGFSYRESISAHLAGAHRALCIYSWVHRGTRERPGLVLGLDRGGSCRGVAYRVEAGQRDVVLAYLRERELVTDVYTEAWRAIRLDHYGQPRVKALTYLVNRNHVQYAGGLDRERILELVRTGHGRSGTNADYVLNTAAHLRDLGFRDAVLDWVAERLGDLDITPQDQCAAP